MAKFPNRNLNQTAVYWSSPTPTGTGGWTWATPVEIKCRWVNSVREILSASGEEIVTRAEVRVSQDLDEQGMLFLGDLEDLTAAQEAAPSTISNAYLIRRFDKNPTLSRPVRFFRKAWL